MTDAPPPLDGRVTLVTGAGRGIGRAIALACADAGATLALTGRDSERLAETRELVERRGGTAIVVTADVGDLAQVEAMAGRVLDELGTIDALVCNSGVAGPTAPLWQVTPAEWEATLRVNLTGAFNCARAVLPAMIERSSGSIVLIGSMTGKRALEGRTPYAASKLGLVGLLRTLAWDAGRHGVRANLISPGAVEGARIDRVIEAQAAAQDIPVEEARRRFTAASPLGRLTGAEDVAAAVVFLASPAAASITGEDLNVSAGVAMH